MLRNSLQLIMFIFLFASLFAGCSNEYKIETFDYKAEYDRVSKTKTADKKKDNVEIVDITKRKSNYRYLQLERKIRSEVISEM